ncbi:MAG: SPOR domain-containing protein [Candidatus Dependentiae bacterium]|nr:SPOR domain-containing protein [Candidatus Dependentiae bacterium]
MFEKNEGLFVRNRHVSMIVSGVLLFNFMLFVGGYFLGQRNSVTAFTNKIDQESFSDQIYSSLCSLCDSGDTEESSEDEENGASSVASLDPAQAEVKSANNDTQDVTVGSALEPVSVVQSALADNNDNVDDVSDDKDATPSAEYYAQLAGFGTEHAAEQFAQRLARKEVSVVVKKRQSRTSRGKFVAWYQVMTEKFDDKSELDSLVKKLEQEEKLKDVRIITC